MATGQLRLTPRQQRVVMLRLRRYGRREIAHQLGISPDGVRRHLDKARHANGFDDELGLLLAADREQRSMG
jgi:DNA-binding CsgD family transcriptional regulator